jgi:hypothetical protein
VRSKESHLQIKPACQGLESSGNSGSLETMEVAAWHREDIPHNSPDICHENKVDKKCDGYSSRTVRIYSKTVDMFVATTYCNRAKRTRHKACEYETKFLNVALFLCNCWQNGSTQNSNVKGVKEPNV